ncbi:MAG: class I SAM-dependent methyltransferase [Rubrivivax sp.]|nr:class I SAM-dependent methyltransferase [Rubrivivax sp.]
MDGTQTDKRVISDDYRTLNRELHRSSAAYGTSGRQWAPLVRHLVKRHGLSDVLDYGCGKQTLAKALPDIKVWGYDPAFEDLAALPAPADLVVCGDVLEHVEPEHLEAVFDDLVRCTRRLAFLVVATRPARKQLADGRNAHLSLMPASRWLSYILPRFDVMYMAEHLPEFNDRGWRQRIARWALPDVGMAAPQSGEVVFLLSKKARPN